MFSRQYTPVCVVVGFTIHLLANLGLGLVKSRPKIEHFTYLNSEGPRSTQGDLRQHYMYIKSCIYVGEWGGVISLAIA